MSIFPISKKMEQLKINGVKSVTYKNYADFTLGAWDIFEKLKEYEKILQEWPGFDGNMYKEDITFDANAADEMTDSPVSMILFDGKTTDKEIKGSNYIGLYLLWEGEMGIDQVNEWVDEALSRIYDSEHFLIDRERYVLDSCNLTIYTVPPRYLYIKAAQREKVI